MKHDNAYGTFLLVQTTLSAPCKSPPGILAPLPNQGAHYSSFYLRQRQHAVDCSLILCLQLPLCFAISTLVTTKGWQGVLYLFRQDLELLEYNNAMSKL